MTDEEKAVVDAALRHYFDEGHFELKDAVTKLRLKRANDANPEWSEQLRHRHHERAQARGAYLTYRKLAVEQAGEDVVEMLEAGWRKIDPNIADDP
jgi:hypothetical protein